MPYHMYEYECIDLSQIHVDTFSGEATLSKLFLSPSEKGAYFRRKEFAPPFQKGIGIHESKQEFTKSDSLKL